MGDSVTFHIPAQHPAFEGHFPGMPLLPGVVLLDEVLRAVMRTGLLPAPDSRREMLPNAERDDSGSAGGAGSPRDHRRETGAPGHYWTISSAKFLHPVRPGETLTLEHESLANGSIRFTIRGAGQPVASGTLVPLSAAAHPTAGSTRSPRPPSSDPNHGDQTR